jgi:hypothetical protein
MLHNWRIDDDDALEQSGWLGQPIAVARPDGVAPGRVGFWISRDLAGVSCVSRPSQALLVTCPAYHAHLEAQGLGVDIP